jgi:hypothetical protein
LKQGQNDLVFLIFKPFTMDDIILFEESKLLGGYAVAVLDDWETKIRRRHITEKEKELYLQEFGDNLIKDSKFYKWLKEVRSGNKS